METLEKSLRGLNLLREKRFESEMNDPIIVIDKTHIPGFVRQKFSLWIHNTSDATLYFKLVEQIPNWVLLGTSDIPLDGKIGAISAGNVKHFIGAVEREVPAGESEDAGNFKVEAYTDAGYTNLLESHSHPTTIYVEDLESWANVQKSDFDDGSSQGWTLSELIVSGDQSVEDGGYSVKCSPVHSTTITPFLSKSVSLPNTNKVRLSFYWFAIGTNGPYVPGYLWGKNLRCYVDGDKVYECFKPEERCFYITVPGNSIRSVGWFKGGVDLSSYKGQTRTIKIQVDFTTSGLASYTARFHFDDIIIAGKD